MRAQRVALRREVAALRDRSSHAGTTVIAESPAMRRVFELVGGDLVDFAG